MLEKNYYRAKNNKDHYSSRGGYRSSALIHSVQDPFLGYCVREAAEVNVLLKNDGVKTGYIRGYDNWSLLVSDKEEAISLIFKSGVSAITPVDEINWAELHHPLNKAPLLADSRAHHSDYFA